MDVIKKINYWKRIFSAYIIGNTSQLSFWHNQPRVHSKITKDEIGPYYMVFEEKANYDSFSMKKVFQC